MTQASLSFPRRVAFTLFTLSSIPLTTTSFGYFPLIQSRVISSSSFVVAMAQQDPSTEYYRSDGVRIHHDPYASGMASKYGLPGETDPEGFVSDEFCVPLFYSSKK